MAHWGNIQKTQWLGAHPARWKETGAEAGGTGSVGHKGPVAIGDTWTCSKEAMERAIVKKNYMF